MRKWLVSLLITIPMSLAAQLQPVARVSALANGRLLLNGQPASLVVIDAEFKKLQTGKGVVWYYRENAREEPRPEALSVVELVVKYSLPISMSSKSDFSDYIDANGQPQPRRP